MKFSDELNTNNKLPFLDVLNDTNYDTFTTSRYKTPTTTSTTNTTITNSCTRNYRSKYPEQYKITMIKNLIFHAKLISSIKIIFYSELKNFLTNIVDEQIKRAMKNINSNCNGKNATSNNPTHIQQFFVTKCTNIMNSMKSL